MVFSGYSGFLHQTKWPPRNNWNIVESGVKLRNDNPNPIYYQVYVTSTKICVNNYFIPLDFKLLKVTEAENISKAVSNILGIYYYSVTIFNILLWLIDWCLTPTLAIFQLNCGVNKFYNILLIFSFDVLLYYKLENDLTYYDQIHFPPSSWVGS